jgi:co-chaperonin GroES (HSP10)
MADISKVRPIGRWVLIKVDPPPEKTKSGLYLPQGNLQERLGYKTGVILAVGSGLVGKKGKITPFPFGVKDRVYFRGFLAELHNPGGMLDKEHCIIAGEDIYGIVEDWEEHDGVELAM